MDAKRPSVLCIGELPALCARLTGLSSASAHYRFTGCPPAPGDAPLSLHADALSAVCARIEDAEPDLLILDYEEAGDRAFAELREAHLFRPTLLIIFVNSSFSRALAERAFEAGASAAVFQGFGAAAVLEVLERLTAGERNIASPPSTLHDNRPRASIRPTPRPPRRDGSATPPLRRMTL